MNTAIRTLILQLFTVGGAGGMSAQTFTDIGSGAPTPCMKDIYQLSASGNQIWPDGLNYNASRQSAAPTEATIVGCQWLEGRWPDKSALEFRSVSDRVRLTVPGEFESVTLAAWVLVQGLDRKFNSLFMCDGFAPGNHSLADSQRRSARADRDRSGSWQISNSGQPPMLNLDEFGMSLNLAVVLDGSSRRVAHYVNGRSVSEQPLRLKPPRIGAAELGNWNASGFPNNDPSLIRNFSGAMDEFRLFRRALSAEEIRKLYSEGKPQADPQILK